MCDDGNCEIDGCEPNAPLGEILKLKEAELFNPVDGVMYPDYPIEQHDNASVDHEAT